MASFLSCYYLFFIPCEEKRRDEEVINRVMGNIRQGKSGSPGAIDDQAVRAVHAGAAGVSADLLQVLLQLQLHALHRRPVDDEQGLHVRRQQAAGRANVDGRLLQFEHHCTHRHLIK